MKKILKSLFTYTPKKEYEFDILENKNEKSFEPTNKEIKDNNEAPKEIFSSLQENITQIKTMYNTLINSDIIIREFTLNARGKQYSALLLYIDGMVDSNIMNNYILKPLMMRNDNNQFRGDQNKNIYKTTNNNVSIRKVKKFDITKYLLDCLIPQNSVKKIQEFDKVTSGVNSGNCVLFIDTLNTAFDIEVKGFKQRSINSPNNEVVIKGSQEAFVENIRTNTSILRRIINNENLIIENVDVGIVSKTKVRYMLYEKYYKF